MSISRELQLKAIATTTNRTQVDSSANIDTLNYKSAVTLDPSVDYERSHSGIEAVIFFDPNILDKALSKEGYFF